MNEGQRKRLEQQGWTVGSIADFLELRPEEAAFIDLKVTLGEGLRRVRERAGLSQTGLAERLGSSQSRVSKMEAADSSVSVDLMIRALLALGASRQDLAALMEAGRKTA